MSGRVFDAPVAHYIIVYEDQRKYLYYGRHENNNVAVKESWKDKIYKGKLYELDSEDFHNIKNLTRFLNFEEISLEEALLLEA